MNIDITEFFKTEDASIYSGNMIEYGENVGAITWANSMAGVKTYKHLEDGPDGDDIKRVAWREWVKSSGGWTKTEVDSWTHDELEALFIQWVSGDMRESGLDGPFEDIDWAQYELDAEAGRCPGRIWRDVETGRIFFSLE